MSPARTASLALAAVAAIYSGCGGSSAKTPQTAPNGQGAVATQASSHSGGQTMSRGQLIAIASTICGRANTEVSAYTRGKHADTRAEVVGVVEHRSSIEQGELAELTRLLPPSSLAASWQRLVAERRQVATLLHSLGEAVEYHNLPGQRTALSSLSSLGPRLEATASSLGAAVCGQIQ